MPWLNHSPDLFSPILFCLRKCYCILILASNTVCTGGVLQLLVLQTCMAGKCHSIQWGVLHLNITLQHLNTQQHEAQRRWMTDQRRREARSNVAFQVWRLRPIVAAGFLQVQRSLSTSLGGLQELNKAAVTPGWMAFVPFISTLH